MTVTMLDCYKRETPLRAGSATYKSDVKAVMALRSDQWESLATLVTRRKREVIEGKVLDIYEARRKRNPDCGKAVCQSDVFEMLTLQDYDPDPTTQWPMVKAMLLKAKAGSLSLPEFLLGSFRILVQEKAY